MIGIADRGVNLHHTTNDMPLNLPRVSTAVASPSLSGPTHMLCHCHSSLTTPAPHHPNRSYIRSIMRFLILTLTLPAMAAAAACSSDCEKEFTGTVLWGSLSAASPASSPSPHPASHHASHHVALSSHSGASPACPASPVFPFHRALRRGPATPTAPPHQTPARIPILYPTTQRCTTHNPSPTPLHHTRCYDALSHTRRKRLAHTLTRSLHLRPASLRSHPPPRTAPLLLLRPPHYPTTARWMLYVPVRQKQQRRLRGLRGVQDGGGD